MQRVITLGVFGQDERHFPSDFFRTGLKRGAKESRIPPSKPRRNPRPHLSQTRQRPVSAAPQFDVRVVDRLALHGEDVLRVVQILPPSKAEKHSC